MRLKTEIRNQTLAHFGLVMVIAVLMLLATVGCGSDSTQSSAQPTSAAAEPPVVPTAPLDTVPAPTATEAAPQATAVSEAPLPDGWVTHANQGCQYEISYPPEMQIADQDATSQLLAFNIDSPGRGATNFIYVSLVDQDGPATGEVIYNYDAAETETLLNMQVGEIKALRDIADVAPWFTYERLPDTTIAGHEAQTYENAQPWEFPIGTKEIRYYLTTNDCLYLIGAYFDTTGSNYSGAIDEKLFDQVIATINLDG